MPTHLGLLSLCDHCNQPLASPNAPHFDTLSASQVFHFEAGVFQPKRAILRVWKDSKIHFDVSMDEATVPIRTYGVNTSSMGFDSLSTMCKAIPSLHPAESPCRSQRPRPTCPSLSMARCPDGSQQRITSLDVSRLPSHDWCEEIAVQERAGACPSIGLDKRYSKEPAP